MSASSPQSADRFFAKPTAAKRTERGIFWLLSASTYFVLACASVIFLDIGLKGGGVVFQARPPFVNVDFLTK